MPLVSVGTQMRMAVGGVLAKQSRPNEIAAAKKRQDEDVKKILAPFPPLAVEIVRHILEFAAHQDKVTSTSLARVSKEVHTWITPIIYHTVVLSNLKQLQAFCRTVQTSQSHVATIIRILIIRTCRPNDILDSIADAIRGCTQLESLVAEGDMSNPVFRVSPDSSPGFPAPWHMMMLDSGLEGLMPPLGHPLLRNVTHLYIYALDVDDANDIALVLSLRHLTHLACGCFMDEDHWHAADFPSRIERVLTSPSLRMVLLHSFTYVKWPSPAYELVGPTWKELAQIEDARLFARPGLNPDLDYISLVKAGGTVWDDAEVKYKDWRNLVKDAEEDD